jgi:penicillin-binding protein 1B
VRSRIGVAILIAFLAFTAFTTAVLAWYGLRVFTELRPGSWRTPTTILDRNGNTLLELYGTEWRVTEPVVLKDLPDHVPNAFLAAEDVRFRRHFGIDPRGVARALLRNVKAGGIAEGGSTITQQLARSRFLSSKRTYTRKAVEAVMAVIIEVRLTKDEILEAYLNDVYLGHRDGRAMHGLDEAARAYFNKSPKNLTVFESALLASMIRAPNIGAVSQRRNMVLRVMLDRGWISKDEYDSNLDRRVRFRAGTRRPTPHPYVVSALRAELIDRVGERRVRGGGLKIHTAIDADMQRAAESAVRGGTQRLRGRYSWLRRREPLQAAILSVDPRTGGVRALVGGSDFRKSQFDRTRRMRRQPGSAFKPFTYAAAIASKKITPATIVEDEPVTIRLARRDIWRPQNYDEQFRGKVTVREAFEKSLNAPAVRIADEIGVSRVRNVLDDAGIEGELSDTPAIALGVDDVSMRELVSAYTVFPNLGLRTEPHLIEKVERGSRTIYRAKVRPKKTLDANVAYIVHSLMRGVVQRGTGADLNHVGLGHIAGKTGTTNDYRDAWFIGYAPDLLAAAWVGFDDGKPLRISSAEAALPIWVAFMARASHQRAEIQPPDGVTIAAIEPASGLLWRSGCGVRFEEAFLSGTEPEEKCRGWTERPRILIAFQEPPIMTPEESLERAKETPDLDDVQIVIDPAGLPPRDDDDDPDELDEEERKKIDEQLEKALEKAQEKLSKELEKDLEKLQKRREKKRD